MLRSADPGAHPVPYMISGGTDAKSFARLGIECYGFSPLRMPPDLDYWRLFHGVDERVPVEGLHFGVEVLAVEPERRHRGERRVERNLYDWAASMAMYGNDMRAYPDHNLVAFIGYKICEHMGWNWMKTASWTPPTAKGRRH